MISIDEHWWVLISIDQHWWALMSIDEHWWAMMSNDECSWALMSVHEHWWVLMSIDESWWPLMSVDENWWPLMSVDVNWFLTLISQWLLIVIKRNLLRLLSVFHLFSSIESVFLYGMCIGHTRSYEKFQTSGINDFTWTPLFVKESWSPRKSFKMT